MKYLLKKWIKSTTLASVKTSLLVEWFGDYRAVWFDSRCFPRLGFIAHAGRHILACGCFVDYQLVRIALTTFFNFSGIKVVFAAGVAYIPHQFGGNAVNLSATVRSRPPGVSDGTVFPVIERALCIDNERGRIVLEGAIRLFRA